MPFLKKRRTLGIKLETVSGTAETITQGDCIFAYDITIEPTIELQERPDDNTLSRRTSVVGGRKAKSKFKIEAKGSGTAATSPAWALTCLPACGMKETAGVWKPTSLTGDYKSITLVIFEDNIIKTCYGAMGTWSFKAPARKPAYFEFDFDGLWAPPVDGTLLVPTAEIIIPPVCMGNTLTLGTAVAPVSEFSVQQGNIIALRPDNTATYGYRNAYITGRDYSGKIDPEAVLVATRNVFNELVSGTELALNYVLGSVAGNQITIAGPKAQIQAIPEGDRDGIITHEMEYKLNGNVGDDELSLTFN